MPNNEEEGVDYRHSLDDEDETEEDETLLDETIDPEDDIIDDDENLPPGMHIERPERIEFVDEDESGNPIRPTLEE